MWSNNGEQKLFKPWSFWEESRGSGLRVLKWGLSGDLWVDGRSGTPADKKHNVEKSLKPPRPLPAHQGPQWSNWDNRKILEVVWSNGPHLWQRSSSNMGRRGLVSAGGSCWKPCLTGLFTAPSNLHVTYSISNELISNKDTLKVTLLFSVYIKIAGWLAIDATSLLRLYFSNVVTHAVVIDYLCDIVKL